MTRKAASLGAGAITEEGLSAGPGCCAGALSLGPYGPANLLGFGVSVTGRDAVWSLWEVSRCVTGLL